MASGELESKMSDLSARIQKLVPKSTVNIEDKPVLNDRPITLAERLAQIDAKVANIEGLREAARPEELRISHLPDKYGRAGRYPGY